MKSKSLLLVSLITFVFTASAHAEQNGTRATLPSSLNSVYLQQMATHNPFSNVYSVRSIGRVDISRWAGKVPVKAESSQLWPAERKPVGKAIISKSSISKASKIHIKHAKAKNIEIIEQEVADAIIADIFQHGENIAVAAAAAPKPPEQSSYKEAANNSYILPTISNTNAPKLPEANVEIKHAASDDHAPVSQWSL